MGHIAEIKVRPTVVLADDHARILERVAKLLNPGFDVVATVSDGWMALQTCMRLSPEIAVFDIAMPEIDGIHAARALRRVGCSTRIVFLTVQDDADYIAAALEVGAHGYVLKCRLQSDLIPALQHALADHAFVSPALVGG